MFGFYRGVTEVDGVTRARVCAHAQACAQVGRNGGAWVRVRATMLARAQVGTVGRARACAYRLDKLAQMV